MALVGALLLVFDQAASGIGVNLYVSVPAHHPGAHPSNYVAGSHHSVVWAVGNAHPRSPCTPRSGWRSW